MDGPAAMAETAAAGVSSSSSTSQEQPIGDASSSNGSSSSSSSSSVRRISPAGIGMKAFGQLAGYIFGRNQKGEVSKSMVDNYY